MYLFPFPVDPGLQMVDNSGLEEQAVACSSRPELSRNQTSELLVNPFIVLRIQRLGVCELSGSKV